MTECPNCGALRFTACATHGAWCIPCTKAMSCPGCARSAGRVDPEFLTALATVATILALIPAALWLVALGH
ncbi:MAG: hypothetical protein ABI629_21055 [bacterium]